MTAPARGFVIQIDCSNVKDERKRVHRLLGGIQDEVAAGRSSGGIQLDGIHIGTWGFTR